jgi:hypothetical protein
MADIGDPNIPAQLQDAIRNRVAFLFLRGGDGFVLRPVIEDGVGGVIVWIGWGSGGAPARHLPEVKHLARMIGARWLRFHSARQGFLRTAPKMGFVRLPDDQDGLMVFQLVL